MSGIRARAGPAEVALVLVAVMVAWWLVMGWDWSVVPAGEAGTYRDPHGAADWMLLHAAAIAGAGWLARRGRPVLGVAGVLLVLVALSGWRMAAAEVVGANLWPAGLALLTLTLTAACTAAALAAVRTRTGARR